MVDSTYDEKLGPRTVGDVLGAPIDSIDWNRALNRIIAWGQQHESRYVCICNVHSVITARQDALFADILVNSDMNTPDGAPVAWMLRRQGYARQQRINGPDLMWRHAELAARIGQSIFLYGGKSSTLARLRKVLLDAFPTLIIAGMHSPPFRTLTQEEDAVVVDMINASGAQIVWVGLGCPKQEHWMAAHRGRVKAVMIGVGAAFSYHAGELQRAPVWMRNLGLEWAYRLALEPRRLAKRYFSTNSLFIGLAAVSLIRKSKRKASSLADSEYL